MTPKYPSVLVLQGGREVKVREVHYGLGRNFYRVSYDTKDGPKGCVAEHEGTRFSEVTHEEWLALARGTVKSRNIDTAPKE